MKMSQISGRRRRMLTLAIVGIPWFLRDQLASALEGRSAAAQQVQAALDTESQRQLQERDQREASERLVRIEHLLEKDPGSVEKDPGFDKEIDAAGRQLTASVEQFEARLKTLALDDDDVAPVVAAADSAKAVAAELMKSYGEASTTPQQDDALLARFDSASAHFEEQLQELSTRSVADAAAYSRWAGYSRFGAWLMTGLGVLMMGGGWSRLLGGPDDASQATADE
ncbi:MAG: hypothetical protein HYX65_01675 [Gemmatimonadetes bacterium]|nr:hypothetical protein [Gemmatimonadota bacterium]